MHRNRPKNFNKFIFTLTVQTDSSTVETFALKIENWNYFLIFLNSYSSKTREELKSDARRLAKQYSDSSDKSTRGYAQVLLKYMSVHNIKGVSLYKAKDKEYQSWNKLSLDIDKNILTEKPCL